MLKNGKFTKTKEKERLKLWEEKVGRKEISYPKELDMICKARIFN